MKQAAPIGTLADHAGRYRIWLHCRCGHAKRFDAGELAQRLGAGFPNRLLVERCRCEVCGARGGSMTLEPAGAVGYAERYPGRAVGNSVGNTGGA